MKEWSTEKAIETLNKIAKYEVTNVPEDAKNIMRLMFCTLTLKGKMVFNGRYRQIWEDYQGNFAFIDRTRNELGVFYAGEKWVLDRME